jgi:hypothetical protein
MEYAASQVTVMTPEHFDAQVDAVCEVHQDAVKTWNLKPEWCPAWRAES